MTLPRVPGVLVVEDSGRVRAAGAGCGSLRALTRAAIAAPRSPKRERRGPSAAARAEQRLSNTVCPSGRSVFRYCDSCNSLQLGVSWRSAGRRSARRRCAFKLVLKLVIGILW